MVVETFYEPTEQDLQDYAKHCQEERKMSRKPLTKQGEHGTLYRYKISYKGQDDPGCPLFSCSLWAYNQEHAEMKFYDSEDADGWEIVSISIVHESNAPAPAYKFA